MLINAHSYIILGIILGYIVCKQGKLPDPTKINDILNMTPTNDQQGIQCILGIA